MGIPRAKRIEDAARRLVDTWVCAGAVKPDSPLVKKFVEQMTRDMRKLQTALATPQDKP